MNKIDFSKQGGFPLDQHTLDFMQEGYLSMLKAISRVAGEKVILSGTQATGGWCVIDGDILEYDRGTGDYCFISESKDMVTFEDKSRNEVYCTRKLVFGIGSPQMNWSEFKPIKDLPKLEELINKANTDLSGQISNVNRDLSGAISKTNESLGGHIGKTSGNPHKVTKNEVGLGNLPNEKSDSTTSKNNEILATSKAISDLYDKILNSLPKIEGELYYEKLNNPNVFPRFNGLISRTGYNQKGFWTVFLSKSISTNNYLLYAIGECGVKAEGGAYISTDFYTKTITDRFTVRVADDHTNNDYGLKLYLINKNSLSR